MRNTVQVVTKARRSAVIALRLVRCAPGALALMMAALAMLPSVAAADQASQPGSPAAGYVATGALHSCAVVPSELTNALRCWGYGGHGALGYGSTRTIGDDETPASVAPVDLGASRITAIAGGSYHTCALMSDGAVRCWGFGADGRLGYGNTDTIGDDEAPLTAGIVDLGVGRSAKAIAAGDGHTCALLDDGAVRCWGFNLDGRLGYGHTDSVGDNEKPSSHGPVKFGDGLTAKAITAGGSHTCALLDDGGVRCWGFGGSGRLGYANSDHIGRTPGTTPDTVGAVDLSGRAAKAVTAGYGHTCAILDDDTVRCWGFGGSGRLGYRSRDHVGDDEHPGSKPPVDLGLGRTARAIHAGFEHTCAVLDNGHLRCWGSGALGRLGYGNRDAIGDDEHPGDVGPVRLGAGRTATAISAGAQHTCARLDDGSVRCWGYGAHGRLGLCSEAIIGADESPDSVGPVDLGIPGIAAQGCAGTPQATDSGGAGGGADAASALPAQLPSAGDAPRSPAPDQLQAARAAEQARTIALRACRRDANRKVDAERRRARRLSAARRRGATRKIGRLAARLKATCLRRHGRVPGRVGDLAARAVGNGKVELSFRAPGTDGAAAPAARGYLIKQSRRPIRTARDFARAAALCRGKCSFDISQVGATVALTISDLRRGGLYYYAVAARDNVSPLAGPRSKTIRVRVR